MSYSVKVIVHAAADPEVLLSVRSAVEPDGVRVQEFTVRDAADGGKELYVELRLSNTRVLGGIVRRVEAVKGAAIMATTKPQGTRGAKGIPG